MNRRAFLSMASMAAASETISSAARVKEQIQLDASWYQRSRHFISLNFGKISYVEYGHGPAALFLHAFPLNGFQWRGIIPQLAKHRRCIAPDFMALGYTEAALNQEITAVTQADMLAELIDALRLKSADIIANDTGGEVAQLLVARHPQLARTLLISNCDVSTNSPPPLFKPVLAAAQSGLLANSFERLLSNKDFARSSKGLGAFYSDPTHLTDEAIEYYLSPIVSSPIRKEQFNRFAASFANNPLVAIEQELKQSQLPVRILWAVNDTMFDAKWADWLDQSFPHSRGVRRMEGARLFFPEEAPGIVVEEALNLWRN